jgi:hypothetical protein
LPRRGGTSFWGSRAPPLCLQWRKGGLPRVGGAIPALFCTPASAALVPASAIVHTQAEAQVGGNSLRLADEMDDSDATGDFSPIVKIGNTFSPSHREARPVIPRPMPGPMSSPAAPAARQASPRRGSPPPPSRRARRITARWPSRHRSKTRSGWIAGQVCRSTSPRHTIFAIDVPEPRTAAWHVDLQPAAGAKASVAPLAAFGAAVRPGRLRGSRPVAPVSRCGRWP